MVAATFQQASPAPASKLGVKHIKIKPYTPQTNGKAERFIQTTLRERAYATVFEHSEQRYRALPA
jgi:transposase InsO family protein